MGEEITANAPAPSLGNAPLPAPAPAPGLSRSLQELLANRRVFLPPPPATRTSPPSEVIPISTTNAATIPTTTKSATAALDKPKNGSELTLAEKSRLSIMKKAMRKESLEGGSSTKKPPVLLQVTKKLPTVVMVEPPSSEPFLRAREVFADSPARLDKVKRLMRHKLVANAKNIHDLTDNWDDLVCDYVDMALLDKIGAANRTASSSVLMLFITVLAILR